MLQKSYKVALRSFANLALDIFLAVPNVNLLELVNIKCFYTIGWTIFDTAN